MRMDKPFKRMAAAIAHLIAVDDFFASADPVYSSYRQRLHKLGEAYESFAKSMYFGSKKRHQQLADILEYMVISRGSIWAAGSGIQQRSDYMRIIFYTINQLLLQ